MAELQQQRAIFDAIAAWTAVLGSACVVSDLIHRSAAERATFQTSQKIPVILRPVDRQQVSEIVRIANRYGVPLYPVSSGKNWGYGSRVPPVTDCALLDLSRMDQIVEFNEQLGYVTVQPGVTQKALIKFLKHQKSKLWMDATGSSPDCSLIGNAMERGFGHTPYGDHFSHVCGLEVVLASGEIVETGYAPLRHGAGRPPARGFHLLARKEIDGLIVYRFISSVPRLVSEAELRRHVITLAHPEVLVPADDRTPVTTATTGSLRS
jgi:4-cresol dehydrogenase (hydroxylating)